MKKIKWVYILSFIVVFAIAFAFTGLVDSASGLCALFVISLIFSIINAVVAFKDDIKFIGVIMIALAILSLILLTFSIKNYIKVSSIKKPDYQLTVVPDRSSLRKLFTYNGKSYYTNGVTNVNIVTTKGQTYSLEEALENNYYTLDDILKEAIPNSDTKGYKIYYDEGQDDIDNSKYSIIVCESSDRIIFGNYNDDYKESLCG